MLFKRTWMLIVFFGLLLACSKPSPFEWTIKSPDASIHVQLSLNKKTGRLAYQVFLSQANKVTEVIESSPLGLIREDQSFDTELSFVSIDSARIIDENYTTVVGKQIVNHAISSESSITFKNKDNALVKLTFKVSNTGVAFRYIFPEQDTVLHTVTKELTGFDLPINGTAWMQPYDSATKWSPGYEKYFLNDIKIGDRSPMNQGWCFPALFQVDSNWILLTESDLSENYVGSHLQPDAANGLYTLRQPELDESYGEGNSSSKSTLPWQMPWRVIMISKTLGGIVESNLVNDLGKSTEQDFSWVKPGRASWSWWSDHDSSKDFGKLKSFVDLSVEMGWEYSLIDANWNQIKSKSPEKLTSAGLGEGSLEDLISYATQKNVGIWLWYNSGGPHNKVTEEPRDIMNNATKRKEEMKHLHTLGIKGIKVDFFQSDKQEIIQLYLDILKDAADNQIMVNFHGCTIPRGWSRTWPNLVSMESVRGAESYSFDSNYPKRAPLHNTIIPFTRNVIGSMDYTPVVFSDQQYPHITTFAHELALSVVFESGVMHFADSRESYSHLPSVPKKFLQTIPTVWDEVKFISGYPGDDIILARKKGGNWYVGCINGEEKEKVLTIDFSFLPDGEFESELIKDGANGKSFAYENKLVTASSKQEVKVLSNGGFAMVLKQKKIKQ